MPRALGTRLHAHPFHFGPCDAGNACRCRRVPHHDHIYDAFHRDLLDILSPVSDDDPRRRIDSGRAFCKFLRGRSALLIERLEGERTASGKPVVRFRTTLVCDKVNAVDGNGKARERSPPLPPEDLTYWSMTPEELARAHGKHSEWEKVLAEDGERRERRSRVKALAQTLVEEHRRAERDAEPDQARSAT